MTLLGPRDGTVTIAFETFVPEMKARQQVARVQTSISHLKKIPGVINGWLEMIGADIPEHPKKSRTKKKT